MKKNRHTKRVVLKAVLLLLLLPVLLFAFIQTLPGKALLAKILTAALSGSDNVSVEIEDIRGWIPGKITIGKIQVGDADGTWLSGRNIHCRWLIREWINQRIQVSKLGAEEINVYRFPVKGDLVREKRDGLVKLPEVELGIDAFQVKALLLHKAFSGTPLSYSVSSGRLSASADGTGEAYIVIDGDAQGQVSLNSVLQGLDSDQLVIHAELTDISKPRLGLSLLAGNGDAVIRRDRIHADLQLDIELGDIQTKLMTSLAYQNRELNFEKIEIVGSNHECTGEAKLSFSEGQVGIDLKSALFEFGAIRFALNGIGTVAAEDGWNLAVEELNVTGLDTVHMKLAGSAGADYVDIQGNFPAMDVSDISFSSLSNFNGKVSGEWSVRGDPADPDTSFSLHTSGFAPSGFQDDRYPALSFSISGGLTNRNLTASTFIEGKEVGYLRAGFSMPCIMSLFPVAFSASPEELAIQLDADFDLGSLNRYSFLDQQVVQGRLACEVDYSPERTTGFLRLKDGLYEHYDLGIIFRNFNALFDLKEDGFLVREASATDGGGGRVGMSGGFSGQGWDLQVDFDNAWVLRQDVVEASMSGWVKAAGPLGRPDFKGKLIINRAEVLLDNLVQEPPRLLVDYDREKTNQTEVAGLEKNVLPFGMDIEVVMPDQVFVNAAMIDAVLGGSLRFRNTARGISVAGSIQPRRGYVSFIGKKFRFTDGDIVLDGSVPSVTTLENMTAEYTRRDFTARLILNGRAEDPDIRLESSPSMPEDEILSHVLFNRDTGSITAYQAYQVAMAARQLSQGLSGPGFMYQFRRAVGVDTLEWREGEGDGAASSVAAGKYITTGLYIEVDRSLEEEGGTAMSAEYEISRHFSIETYTGPQMRPGIGINWRNDY